MNFNPFDLVKNAKAIQEQLAKVQEEPNGLSAVGSAGGGIVRVTLNGQFEILSVELDPVAVDPRDIPMLQDLIAAAHADAMEKIKEEIKSRAGSLAGIPGLGGMMPGFPQS